MGRIGKRKNVRVTADRVIAELAAIAFANATDFAEVTEEGKARLKPTGGLSKRKRAAIVSIRATAGGVEIKLGNKLQALTLLGRYLGAFEPDAEIEELDAARSEVFGDVDY